MFTLEWSELCNGLLVSSLKLFSGAYADLRYFLSILCIFSALFTFAKLYVGHNFQRILVLSESPGEYKDFLKLPFCRLPLQTAFGLEQMDP